MLSQDIEYSVIQQKKCYFKFMNYNPFSLQRKTILVTGASSGIGRRTAIECSKLCARVILTARNEERLKETLSQLVGDGHEIVGADLTTNGGIDEIVKRIPQLDGLVLCAGKSNGIPFKFADRKKYDSIFEINYFAPIELLRQLIKAKKIREKASVVFVSSIGGIEAISIGNTIYGASKAALNSTMKYCALELSPKGIRCNSVMPGMVNTGMIKGGTLNEEQHNADIQRYPLKRYGEPEDIAFGIVYLLSDASSWVTGHSLVIDGGFTI